MARATQHLQIAGAVRPATRERDDVVYLMREPMPALLAHWVCGQEPGAECLKASATKASRRAMRAMPGRAPMSGAAAGHNSESRASLV